MRAIDPVDQFLAGIESAVLSEDIFSEDVVLDATVPNWRFCVRGAAAVRAELEKWYGNLGRFQEVRRRGFDDGELVEFTLGWEESGVPHACHQAHVIHIRDGLIAVDTVFCGGRWPEPLLAQMREAQHAMDRGAGLKAG
ncbi:MAG TPA: hypothetical protein VII76_15690 [Acidimicrobiales bacterium]